MLFEPGDIAACYGTDATSRVISLATCSLLPPLLYGPSHVALIVRDDGARIPGVLPFWFESTTKAARPCLHAKRLVDGPQLHRPQDRIDDYLEAGGRVDLYRLSFLDELTPDQRSRMVSLVERILSRPPHYDMTGAILSGTRLLQLSRVFPAAEFQRFFCSELIAKVLQKVGLMNQGNPQRMNPARMMRRLLRSGIYKFHRRFDCNTPRVIA